ncbi:hypothetical protein BDV06DRAFT_77716 [Aspergillus oleicola]
MLVSNYSQLPCRWQCCIVCMASRMRMLRVTLVVSFVHCWLCLRHCPSIASPYPLIKLSLPPSNPLSIIPSGGMKTQKIKKEKPNKTESR